MGMQISNEVPHIHSVTVAQSTSEIPGLRGSQSVIVHVIRDSKYVPLLSLSAVITAAALIYSHSLSVRRVERSYLGKLVLSLSLE